MEKVSKKTQNDLKCIAGLCLHSCDNKKCLWNKIADSKNPNEQTYKELVKLIKREAQSISQCKKK